MITAAERTPSQGEPRAEEVDSSLRIVSFSYFLPYDGVPHAGGEYYLRHIRALQEAGHRVTVVAPATTENAAAAPPEGTDVILVAERRTAATRLADLVAAQLRHAVLPKRFTAAVLRDPRVIAAVGDASLLEFQWVPSACLYRPLLKRAGRRVPATCVAHDVVSQSLRRQAAQPGLPLLKRALRRVRAAVGAMEERRHLRAMDLVLTFSDKDRALVGAYGVHAEVVDPPLASKDAVEVRRRHDGTRLLFVGAFDRMENQDAADWLLTDIWPRVGAAHPEAILDLVGAHPTPAMERAAQMNASVRVSGYVDDLQPFYAQAALAIVPLRLGAGVKFKVVTAMLQGVPVITTSVGAEGIAEAADDLIEIVDAADAFAAAVVRHLDDPRPGEHRAGAARAAASARYGWTGFASRLDVAYRAIAPTSTR